MTPSRLLRTILNPTSELLPVIPADLRPSVLHQPRVPTVLDPKADAAEVDQAHRRSAWCPKCETTRLRDTGPPWVCPTCSSKVLAGDELRSA
jgi:DNA-directed RNA polymerase subunit RPC12/RpoP